MYIMQTRRKNRNERETEKEREWGEILRERENLFIPFLLT